MNESQGPPPPPDDLEYRNAPGTRVTYRARQRTADATAWLQLALRLPDFLLSLALVLGSALLVEAWLGPPAWIATTLWLLSGTLAFHHPTEELLARYLLRLHRPLPEERALLAPVWHEVTARAGVDGSRYQLWIEDSDDVNALAAAGHIVGVTRYAVENLPRSQLAAVLAHELGHHTGGHAWASLLSTWYGLPGRAVIRGLVRLRSMLAGSVPQGPAIAFTALAVAGAYAALTATYGIPLLLFALPYLSAAVGRRAELRADAQAAVLGFAPMLVQVLHTFAAGEEPADDRSGLLHRLLSSHPDHRTRLHHLQQYL
ncbi:M48 family metalloprotease [Streptomyces sp. NPDC051546]|uniref:M48 family metalloprotease n=1 Tax=Streptomyces sp. NPDC051546 TaxID=3365655 RepID=UPI0037B805A2